MIVDEKTKKEYKVVWKSYVNLFGEEPSRIFLRGTTPQETIDLLNDCINKKEPLEQFYIDNKVLS